MSSTRRALSRWIRSAPHLPADVSQRQDADLQSLERILISFVALRVLGEGANDVAVVDNQLQRQRIRQFAVSEPAVVRSP